MPRSSSSSATPSLRIVPKGEDFRLGDAAVKLSSGYGLTPDDWQADWVRCSLCRRGNGRFAAATSGLAVARQNGKNGGIEVRELFGMVVLGEKFLHTAHEVKTARKAFRRLLSFFENERQFPELAALVLEIRKTNGQEAIALVNGGSIEFVARSSGSGRGYTVDVLVCDEAQELTDDELAALLPTISAAPLRNPQVVFTGTPPDPDKAHLAKGEVFRRVRAEALAGTDANLVFVDFGVPDGPLPDVDDRALWHRTNPALGTRLNIAEVVRERKLMSPEKFARERLGWWGDAAVNEAGAIDFAAWKKLHDPERPAELDESKRTCIAVAVAPDKSWATIGTVGRAVDGRELALVQSRRGIGWVVAEVARLVEKHRPLEVALNPASKAGGLLGDLREAGVEVRSLTGRETQQACGAFQLGVSEGRFAHVGQAELDRAVRAAKLRDRGDAEDWDTRHGVDLSPLQAVTIAAASFKEHAKADYDVLSSVLL